ncbi:PhoH family protein [soil metagenome]
MDVFIKVPRGADPLSILGPAERNVKLLRETLNVRIILKDGSLKVSGEPEAVAPAKRIVDTLTKAAAEKPEKYANRKEVVQLIHQAMADAAEERDHTVLLSREGWEVSDPDSPPWQDHLNVYVAGKPVRAQTPNQQRYLEMIRDHDVVFGIGPAGTGKTYLAVAAAVHLLKIGRARKVILVRPAVEAGEKLGFLPGDLQQKVNPYLRPLLDALHDMMDYQTIRRFMESDVVEIVPLAYMRGRTLNRAVIILDEAQNTTRGQMKMFLTRMGKGSKIIVNGDVTQIDLEDPLQSGLVDAARTLRRVPGMGFCTLDQSDIVRHPMVQRIVEAYERMDALRPGGAARAEVTRSGRAAANAAAGDDGAAGEGGSDGGTESD